jgi:uncharacterized phage protein (TIGR02220 family)
MTNIRMRNENPFTAISNDFLRDPKLSFRSKGILAMLLSHSANFKIYKKDVVRYGTESDMAVDTAWKELVDAGYITSEFVWNKELGRNVWTHNISHEPTPPIPTPSVSTPSEPTGSAATPSEVGGCLEEQDKKNNEEEQVKKKKETSYPSSTDYELFVRHINQKTGKKYRGDDKSKRQFNARVKSGYVIDDLKKAVDSMCEAQYHKENGFQYITPEFATRPDKIEMYLNTGKAEEDNPYKNILGYDPVMHKNPNLRPRLSPNGTAMTYERKW